MSKSARTSASTPPLRVGWLARCLCSASTSNTQLYSVPGRVLIVLTVPSDIWRSSVNNNVVKNSVDSSDDFLTVGACMWGCLNGLKEGNDNRRRFTTAALFARCRSHQLTVPMTCAKSNCLSIFFGVNPMRLQEMSALHSPLSFYCSYVSSRRQQQKSRNLSGPERKSYQKY